MSVATRESKTGISSPSHAIVIGQSGAALAHTGSTGNTLMASVTIPANVWGVNDSIRVSSLWSNDNNANNKIFRIFLNTTESYLNKTNTTNTTFNHQTTIYNRGVSNSQIAANQFGASFGSSTGNTTSSVDTTPRS